MFVKKVKMLLMVLVGTWMSVFALEIQPLPQGSSISRVLYINCLQRTQTQQLLKAYLMAGVNSGYHHPKETLLYAIPKYEKRFQEIDRFFRKRIKDPKYIAYLDKAVLLWRERVENCCKWHLKGKME